MVVGKVNLAVPHLEELHPIAEDIEVGDVEFPVNGIELLAEYFVAPPVEAVVLEESAIAGGSAFASIVLLSVIITAPVIIIANAIIIIFFIQIEHLS